jgi:glycosyltransferase involved in cell wall biosynthesis
MSELKKWQPLWRRLPIIRSLISLWQNWRKKRATPCYRPMGKAQAHPELLPYPVDMFLLLDLPSSTLDKVGVPCNQPAGANPAAYHPTSIAQYALAHWNAYLVNGHHEHKEAFMTQARWLLAHESRLSDDAGGWPIPFALRDYYAPRLWLSALAQGNAVSVLVRAYQLTDEDKFLQAARRAVRTFELDILDGGVNTSLGENGVFFEEVAVYPAAHILSGYILALFGLYDYVTFTKDSNIEELIQRSVTTLHTLVEAFDTGSWTRYDLLHQRLASWFYHSLHVTLFEALARYSGCEHCLALAKRWADYQHRFGCCLRYLIASRVSVYYHNKLKPRLRRLAFGSAEIHSQASLDYICVPITQFPVPGGMRGVLAGVAQVMGDQWQMVYLTNYKGQNAEGLEIEAFGQRITHPWQFPNVWLYCLAGLGKLFALLRHSSAYRLILPQDGVFTGVFAALVGKMAGVRIVCMDHGNVTWLDNPALRIERVRPFRAYPWYRRILSRLRFACYWPSLCLLARVATRYTDQFLIAGDEVEEAYRQRLSVHTSRIIRYAYMVDAGRFTLPGGTSRASLRTEQGIREEAILITMINRLAPEKGLDFALAGIALALLALPPDVRARVRVLIAGDGPLRSQVEADIQRHDLDGICTLWGEAKPSDVITLLGISDIFLYSGTRGTNYSMAVLEAMAAGCAVVASVVPQSNARLLAEGRGIAIAPGDATAIGTALTHLCSDLALCRQMGQMAREYVATYHTAQMLKRNLLRASFFAPSIADADEHNDT